jgi:hypothetical protein
MDPEVWSRLPQEVLLGVLARLPHEDISRLREVCRRWRELLVAKHFTDRIVTVRHSQTPFLLVCVKKFQAVVAYNPARREWMELLLELCPNFQIHSLRAAGFGLLCFKGNVGRKKKDDGDIRLLVCNPITKRWRILPSLPSNTRTSGCVNIIVLNHEPNQFKILFTQIIRESQRRLVATLFESATDSWSTHSQDTTLESIYRSVYVSNAIHCIGSERVHQEAGSPKSRKQGISFDLDRKVFSKFEAPLASEAVGAKKFMELHGALSLVTFSTVPTFASSVQQVDERSGAWLQVHSLPSGSSLGVQGHVPLGQGSYLYFAEPHRQSFSVVCYNLLTNQWFTIDESFSDMRSEGYKLYHPSFCSV